MIFECPLNRAQFSYPVKAHRTVELLTVSFRILVTVTELRVSY